MNNGKKKKALTATNILIVLSVFIYVLDKYIFVFGDQMFETPGPIEKILGFCGGRVFMTLCFFDTSIVDGEIWRSFLFVHLFILHLVVNMVSLYIVGNVVEKRWGHFFLIAVFWGLGILNILVTNSLPFLNVTDTATGGASGAVFGLMGIVAAYNFFDRKNRFIFTKAQKFFLIVYGVVFTYFMGIWTIACHNLGLLMGFTLGIGLILLEKKRSCR